MGHGTTLDAVLARLFGLYLRQRATYPLGDGEIGRAVQVCSAELMRGRLWQLGEWR